MSIMPGLCGLMSSWVLVLWAQVLMLLLVHNLPGTLGLSQDGLHLLTFARGIRDDPHSRLANWNEYDATPCGWNGVNCNGQGQVVSVQLWHADLRGDLAASSFARLPALEILNLSTNFLKGQIPAELAQCQRLQYLNVESNGIDGSIPPELGSLRNLSVLDLRDNNLTGQVPQTLGDATSLRALNVSHNNLNGSLPSTFSRFGSSAFLGNPGLCSADGWLQRCATDSASSDHTSLVKGTLVGVTVVSSILDLLLVIIICVTACIRGGCLSSGVLLKPLRRLPPETKTVTFSFTQAIRAHLILEVAEQLTDNQIVGQGACGVVYRTVLPSTEIVVAVKKISFSTEGSRWKTGLAPYDSYVTEIKTAGRIRHRSIVKLLGFRRVGDVSYLIYEYIPNGSLGDLLHGKASEMGSKSLNWNARFKIALGTAQALSYCHHDCQPAIIHRDIKSNNILLDANLEPKITDFGIAKVIETDPERSAATFSGIAGTYGYIAPEYGFTLKITDRSDVYSFGVVLLELLTGKAPLDPSFIDQGLNIVGWASSYAGEAGGSSGSGNGAIRILDPSLFAADDSGSEYKSGDAHEMALVFNIALLCTLENPRRRPSMKEVVEMLSTVRLCPLSSPFGGAESSRPQTYRPLRRPGLSEVLTRILTPSSAVHPTSWSTSSGSQP